MHYTHTVPATQITATLSAQVPQVLQDHVSRQTYNASSDNSTGAQFGKKRHCLVPTSYSQGIW